MASLKKNYRCVPALQQFYSGGPYAVSSDGSFLVCACDEKINVVDSSTASIRSTLEGDSVSVTSLALSPDDKLLFSSSHSKLIRVWEISSLKCLRSWKTLGEPVMRMACDSSGALLATGGSDGKISVWDVDGGFCTHHFNGHKGVVTSIMFHPDANRLLLFSGSDDAAVRVWDLVGKNCVAVLKEHFSTVTSLAVSENGWTLLSASRDKVVILWDLRNYSSLLAVPTNEVIEDLCVIFGGSDLSACLGHLEPHKAKKNKSQSLTICFLTVGERGIVRIWNSDGKNCIYESQYSDGTVSSDGDHERRGFISAKILPFDQGLLCVTADQQFLFFCPMQSAEVSFRLKLNKRLVGYNEEIVDLKFLGEEEKFLAVATNVEQVRVYEVASMSCSYVLAGHTDIVLCLDTCVACSGRLLIVTGSKDNKVRVWEDESRSCVGIGVGHMGAVGAVAFAKKKKNFFVSGSSDCTIKVWSLEGLAADCNKIAHLKTKAVVAAHDKDINSLAISPNDNYVCSGSQDRTACIWRLPDLVSLVVLRGHKKGIWSVEFSPVDQCVITSSGDKTIKIWAISDGSCLKTFEGHTSSVLRASFVSRGAQFVSSGSDGLLKLWTLKTNECIATYDQHESQVWALAVGKQTEMLATGGRDAVVNLWHDSTAADEEEAFKKEEECVLKSQELENAASDADFCKAIQLAFELRRPHRLFDLFADLCKKKEGADQIKRALQAIGKGEMRILFEYIREWNTKPKLCHIAQFVLFQIFNILPPTEIVEIKGMAELLEGLIPYSQRHFSRIDRLIRSTFLLDYTLAGMSVLDPESCMPAASKDEIKPAQRGHESHEEQKHLPPAEEENDFGDIMTRGKISLDTGVETLSSQKRKSSKSKGSRKKLKEALDFNANAIILQS